MVGLDALSLTLCVGVQCLCLSVVLPLLNEQPCQKDCLLASGKRKKPLPEKRRKHIPLRTCIACQQKRPKRELTRVVRTPEGFIEIDLKGKSPGRGAYLCPNRQCGEIALTQERLGRALKCQVTAEDVAALRASTALLLAQETMAGLAGEDDSGQA